MTTYSTVQELFEVFWIVVLILVGTNWRVLPCISGYDSQVPIDSMQGLDIGSQHGSQYGPMDNLEIGPHGDLNFGSLESSLPPQQGGDNPGMTQWFDTDL